MDKILTQLDREFCKAVQEKGSKAWASYFGIKGTMLTKSGENIIGQKAIEEAMNPFFSNKNNSLIWEPEKEQMSADGSLGYTFGKYRRTYMDQDNNTQVERGRYITLWKKEGHSYVVDVDMGN